MSGFWWAQELGAFEQVCPCDFAARFPLLTCKDDPRVVRADGVEFQTFDERLVHVTLMGDAKAKSKFRVMSVVRLILSVSNLAQLGYSVAFGSTPCLAKGHRMLMLKQFCGQYLSPAETGRCTEWLCCVA